MDEKVLSVFKSELETAYANYLWARATGRDVLGHDSDWWLAKATELSVIVERNQMPKREKAHLPGQPSLF